ncbi:MAG: aspartate--tRNA(Asn) ligase [Candidatus Aenigmatarchaeota archaeon]|nr:MAG: aspartate--tRNA(Asn) ligase [Candidatus Aenigmarchaeota archaeon]
MVRLQKRLHAEDAKKSEGDATVAGWVKSVRAVGKLAFVILRDSSGTIQLTFKPDVKDFESVKNLTPESVIAATGDVVRGKVKSGENELVVKEWSVLSRSETPLPIDVWGNTPTGLDKRLDWRYLDLRSPKNLLVFRIQTAVEAAMREFWLKNGFIEIHSPKIMGSPSETGAELFEVEYFGRSGYLAQSPQFYKQMAMMAGFEKVFEIAPVFRANPSETSRHDTEYTSVDAEMSWLDSEEDVMAHEEKMIVHVLESVKKQFGSEIKEAFGVDVVVPETPFPRVTIKEAHKITGRAPAETHDFTDLDSEGEKLMGTHIQEKKKHEFVFLTEFPWAVRPFYTMRNEKNPAVTKSFDLLWKGLEITSGSQREHRYDVLLKQAAEKKMKMENVQFYLDFFRYGTPPHGGLGFGLTRFLMQMLGVKNVREVTFVPHDMKRLVP